MSDEEALLSDSHTVDRNNKDKSPPKISKGASVAPPDLVKTFSLFRTYLDSSLQSIKTELIESQDSKVHDLSRKLRKDISSSLKSEGNRIQFDFNDELLSDVDKLYKRLTRENDEKSIEIVDKLADKLRKRNKLIRIADSSSAGWATVKQYETNEIASDSDDEKRLRQAETRALKSITNKKQRYKPYDNARSYGSYYSGPSAAAGTLDHYQRVITTLPCTKFIWLKLTIHRQKSTRLFTLSAGLISSPVIRTLVTLLWLHLWKKVLFMWQLSQSAKRNRLRMIIWASL